MSVEQEFKLWLDESQERLIKSYDTLGLRASGRWAKSLSNTVEEQPNKLIGRINGEDYSYYMVNGRGKNSNQDPEALKRWVGWAGSTFLAKWVKDKGIDVNPYAVAWKIARKGIAVPNKYNDGKLLSMTFTPDWMAELTARVGTAIIKEFGTKKKR